MILNLKRGVHLLRETPEVRFLRRELRDPDLVTYWSTDTCKWVLGYWLSKDRGVVGEVEDIGDSFDMGPILSKEFVNSLRISRAPTNWDAHRQRIRSNRNNKLNEHLDDLEEMRDQKAYLRKQGVQPVLVS